MPARAPRAAGALVLLACLLVACSGGSPSRRTARRSTSAASASSAPSNVPPTSVAAPSAPPSAAPCGRGGTPPAVYDHVVWIWMENHTRADVIGNPHAPFENDLARECGSATSYAAVGSPSLPNYVAATSGSTQGIGDDADPSAHPLTVDNLFRQVRAAGGTARSYEEAMPGNCALSSGGSYAVKHNPAAYYVGASDRAACGTDDVPLGTVGEGPLHDDLARGTLPTF